VTYSLADTSGLGTYSADVSWQTDPGESGLQYSAGGSLTESATASRKRINALGSNSSMPLAEGIRVKIGKSTSVGNDFRIYKIEAELHQLEQSK
jgi:hypothetical protein